MYHAQGTAAADRRRLLQVTDKLQNLRKENQVKTPIWKAAVSSTGNTDDSRSGENRKTLNDYVKLALKQAQKAAESGTYGVGGILMDRDGGILCEMHNRVIRGSRIYDPTAHGERQIVDWYLEHKEKMNLPEPEDCILITTLDPCVMCTGALAQAGFGRVIAIAMDKFAGINWKGSDDCSALEGTGCQKYVSEHFTYPAVTGEKAREAYGAELSDLKVFQTCTVSTDIFLGCHNAFEQTLSDVHEKLFSKDVDVKDIQNPAELAADHPIYRYLKASFGEDCFGCTWKPGESADVITEYMAEKHPGFDGTAYFDMFGNLLCLAEKDPDISSRSAFMNVTRKYAAVRNTEPIEGYEINSFLSHPQHGYFVYMTCPKLSDVTVMELGAIASTLGNQSIHPIMYINGKENEEAAEALIRQLPPLFYEQLHVHFKQIV